MVHRLGICLAMRLSGRHSTASAASLAAEDDGGADDIRAAYPATAVEAPVSSQPAFDERGGTASEAVTKYAAHYAPLLDGSAGMRAIRAMVESIADTDATVLLRGESGVGKDLVAHALHAASRRCNGPFIKVNCAAIPRELLESELFGHEKGAFTGAHRRKPGQFEYANKGTIFPSPSRPSSCMSFRTFASPGSAGTGSSMSTSGSSRRRIGISSTPSHAV